MYSSFSPLLTFYPLPSMALKLPIPFPIFAPQFNPNPTPLLHSSPTEIRFSRWNNANAEKFEQRRQSQQEIEDQIRRDRRFDSATRIANLRDSESSTATVTGIETFRSVGTPSSPSNPSIPGRKSKYSKNPDSFPPFRQVSKTQKTLNALQERPIGVKANVSISEDGVSYVIDGAPFEFKYSYTEAPKLKPIKLREPPYAPFGPTTIPRPWTGRAPLPPSKKKLAEFDSFQLPPKDKKGVKPVQAPGPFLPGSGPKYVKSREEILGEPLTEEEIKMLVQGCMKSSRQLNIGRDGLTHNMLDNIHSHWKRRRVCKIKCKGVCTVDMNNVKQQLEEKTGGKIIYSRGGSLYLYRGRNYNYRTSPRFPLMLWKPAAPVYPRLIQRVPEGLTPEEATEMRKKGRKLIPICKLGKNGVYSNLVEHVREAFGECELVRINCQGMNGSDFRKIGAKLKDLVPCVLVSFESEHILMWRGRDWKSSLPSLGSDPKGGEVSKTDEETIVTPSVEQDASVADATSRPHDSTSLPSVVVPIGANEVEASVEDAALRTSLHSTVLPIEENEEEAPVEDASSRPHDSIAGINEELERTNIQKFNTADVASTTGGEEVKTHLPNSSSEDLDSTSEANSGISDIDEAETERSHQSTFHAISAVGNSQALNMQTSRVAGVLLLLKQAIENGSAVVLDESSLDSDIVYQKTMAFSVSAPAGPVFRHYPRRVKVDKSEEPKIREFEAKEVSEVSVKEESKKKDSKSKGKKSFGEYNFNAPHGSLGVDELAKLLA